MTSAPGARRRAAGTFYILTGTQVPRGRHPNARVGPVKASVFSTIEPACTLVLAALFLGEPITPARVVGGALILGAVILLAREGGAADLARANVT